MNLELLTQSQQALIELLDYPDPPDLAGKRVSRCIYADPAYDRDWMTQQMVLMWLAHSEHDKDEGRIQ